VIDEAAVDLRVGRVGHVVRPPVPDLGLLAGGKAPGGHGLGRPRGQPPVVEQLPLHHAGQIRLHPHDVDHVERAVLEVGAGHEPERARVRSFGHRHDGLFLGQRRDLQGRQVLDRSLDALGVDDRPATRTDADLQGSPQDHLGPLAVRRPHAQPLLLAAEAGAGLGAARLEHAHAHLRLAARQRRTAPQASRAVGQWLLRVRVRPITVAAAAGEYGNGQECQPAQERTP
jgi:hypothetical protein